MARLRAGVRRRVRVVSVGTAAPCFTACNVKSRIAACSNHLKNLHGFCSQDFSQLLRLCDSQQSKYVPSLREACVEVTRTKFFVANGISILYLWNIQLTFEQEKFKCNERYH